MNKGGNQNVTGMQIHLTMDSRVAECYVQQVLGRKCNNNWRNELNREQMDVVDKDLKWLKVRYELPNGSKRQFKCNGGWWRQLKGRRSLIFTRPRRNIFWILTM